MEQPVLSGIYVAELEWARGVSPGPQTASPAGGAGHPAEFPFFSAGETFVKVTGDVSPPDDVSGSTRLACLASARVGPY